MIPAATICPELRTGPPLPAVRHGALALLRSGWWCEREFWLLLTLVAAIYTCRLTAQPICGEESRWANGAAEMIASGDWIVPRQQGEVFPERPPLGSWTMAAVAFVWGRMDAVAVRLPSVLAMFAITAVVYGYGRTFMTRLGALGAAAVYAAGGQVLVLGRLGESESLFACLLGSALLVWHWGYSANWRPVVTWIAAYTLAALAALDKGSQAPVYMATASVAYLALIGDWKYLLSWAHLAGLAAFAIIVGAWQIPFFWATSGGAVADIWSGLAADRYSLAGLARHMLTYPWETIGCLLPWSPMLVAFFFYRFRRTLSSARPQITFLLTALAVTYPSVWLSAGARGRYFMPLYPCLALVIGLVIQNWAGGKPDSLERWAWRWFLRSVSLLAVAGSVVILVATCVPVESLADYREPLWLAAGFFVLATAHAWLLWAHGTSDWRTPRWQWLDRVAAPGRRLSPHAILLLLVAFLGVAYVGPLLNLRLKKMNDLAPQLAALRAIVPDGEELISFGPVAHRFVYFYGRPIRQLRWPTDEDVVPEDVTYFCYDQHRGDTAQWRLNGRGRKWSITPATLPFDWEPVGIYPAAPLLYHNPDTTVIVGRILRPEERPPTLADADADFDEIAHRSGHLR